MAQVFSEKQLIDAMQAAERENPPVASGVLSKPVAKIADIFGALVYQRVQSISVEDPDVAALIEKYLA